MTTSFLDQIIALRREAAQQCAEIQALKDERRALERRLTQLNLSQAAPPQRAPAPTNNVVAQVVVAMTTTGDVLIEAPGTSNGARRKIEREPGETEWGAILRALIEQRAAWKADKLLGAAKLAQAAHERHENIVAYAATQNPATLRYIEPGAKPRARLKESLKTGAGFSIAEIDTLAKRNFELALARKAGTASPISSDHIPL